MPGRTQQLWSPVPRPCSTSSEHSRGSRQRAQFPVRSAAPHQQRQRGWPLESVFYCCELERPSRNEHFRVPTLDLLLRQRLFSS
ncbi:hypothetical protein NDU88_004034 [Pleurodeles waltl]|uniref:Uncharacterized protein n=1 Tax=Pleurodeles waltl TaxID=8319 RepID=A0AAV7QDQ4_PLEWA|nr:hypothetical protein NDU88_004034 [Pleurodeles waltl]